MIFYLFILSHWAGFRQEADMSWLDTESFMKDGLDVFRFTEQKGEGRG